MLQESSLNKKHTTYNCPEVIVFVQPSAEPKSNHNTKIWNRGLKALMSLHIYKQPERRVHTLQLSFGKMKVTSAPGLLAFKKKKKKQDRARDKSWSKYQLDAHITRSRETCSEVSSFNPTLSDRRSRFQLSHSTQLPKYLQGLQTLVQLQPFPRHPNTICGTETMATE